MSETPFKIVRWAVPDEGWLRIDVKDDLLGMSESYYWCEQNEGTEHNPRKVWAWRCWSMGGKPTVKIGSERQEILTRLVLAHPVLGLLDDHFGYREGSR